MKTIGLILLILLLPTSTAVANCELDRFRWECDLPTHPEPSKSAYSLVYCGNTYGYLNRADYEQLVRYQRANVNMVLTINGDYIDSPCIASGRFGAE